MTQLYTTNDITSDALAGQTLAILGYGSQGRAHALNLRDSGFEIRLGLRPGGASSIQAQADGFTPMSPADAARGADLIAMLTPDMSQAELYAAAIAPGLKEGALLLFAHGFNIHFNLIDAPKTIDIGLVAPKSPGALVRRTYTEGNGVPCLIAIHQDATGTAFDRTLAYAHGIGGTRAGVFETTFAEETETDLFGEQAVLCGGATELVLAGFETLTEAGYAPEIAYFECLHELKLIVDLLHEGGIARMHQFISETASFGDLTRGPRIIDAGTRQRMRDMLKEIQSGQFAKEWIEENKNGKANYQDMLDADLEHPIEAVGRDLRSRMSWLPRESSGTSIRTPFDNQPGLAK
ncbi:MAG: ketol-acid reductoisomerase [Myxococcota bacterium]|jgi:ketol-acid reductoisomerase